MNCLLLFKKNITLINNNNIFANKHNAIISINIFTSVKQRLLKLKYSSHMFSGISFDDIPIMMIALVIIILMIGTLKIGMKEGYGPIIGIIGQAYVVYSFIITNPSWLTYMLICLAILVIGYVIRMSLKKKQA